MLLQTNQWLLALCVTCHVPVFLERRPYEAVFFPSFLQPPGRQKTVCLCVSFIEVWRLKQKAKQSKTKTKKPRKPESLCKGLSVHSSWWLPILPACHLQPQLCTSLKCIFSNGHGIPLRLPMEKRKEQKSCCNGREC